MRRLGRGLLVPGCPAAVLDRRQRAVSAAERYNESSWKPGVAAGAGETEKTQRRGDDVRKTGWRRHEAAALRPVAEAPLLQVESSVHSFVHLEAPSLRLSCEGSFDRDRDTDRDPVAFALALRVAMTELDEEMRKQGVGWTTELEYWAYVDDITIATTAELAPLVMAKLRETLERHGQLRRILNGNHDRSPLES